MARSPVKIEQPEAGRSREDAQADERQASEDPRHPGADRRMDQHEDAERHEQDAQDDRVEVLPDRATSNARHVRQPPQTSRVMPPRRATTGNAASGQTSTAVPSATEPAPLVIAPCPPAEDVDGPALIHGCEAVEQLGAGSPRLQTGDGLDDLVRDLHLAVALVGLHLELDRDPVLDLRDTGGRPGCGERTVMLGL